ncbi:hypothetical protein KM043_005507 [Ampulex compressa]|nr:hypothetical protein KM043_005507 [Ampulex compressa]
MSQDYLHACERAELLGLPIPSEEEWKETVQAQGENQQEDETDAVIQELDESHEASQRISGGLDELNSILNATQKKINRFKNVCSSLGTLLKVKVGSQNSTPNHKPVDQSHDGETEIRQEEQEGEDNIAVDLSNDAKDLSHDMTPYVTKRECIFLRESVSIKTAVAYCRSIEFNMPYTVDYIKQKLIDGLNALHVEVVDQSDGCGANFSVVVVSNAFEGKHILQRHRLVNAVLEEELKTIHAFSQKTLTLEQWEKLKA